MGRVQVLIPAVLRDYWGGGSKVALEVSTVGEALAALGPLASRVLDDAGRVRRHVHVFLNRDAVSDLAKPVADGDVIHILPAVSGGFS